MASYAVRLVTRYDGLVIASFPDLPGVTALGRDDEEAREEARRALAAELAAYEAKGAPPHWSATSHRLKRLSPLCHADSFADNSTTPSSITTRVGQRSCPKSFAPCMAMTCSSSRRN